jgi:hypothetical protein
MQSGQYALSLNWIAFQNKIQPTGGGMSVRNRMPVSLRGGGGELGN